MKSNSISQAKSFEFAVRIVKLCRKLKNEQKEYELSSQLIRSGTAVGAILHESRFAESRKDFLHKLTIALKEANETSYWIELLYATDTILKEDYQEYSQRIDEIIRLLIASTKTLKFNK